MQDKITRWIKKYYLCDTFLILKYSENVKSHKPLLCKLQYNNRGMLMNSTVFRYFRHLSYFI